MKTTLSFLIFLFALPIFCSAQELMPDELAIEKAEFLKKVRAIADAEPDDLNKKYLGGLSALLEQKQEAGNLDAVLAIRKEIETLKKSGTAGKDETSPQTGLPNLRKIYQDSHLAWQNNLVDSFENAKKEYLGALKKLVVQMTKANRIEEALVVRSEAESAGKQTILDFAGDTGAFDPSAPSMTSTSRSGRVQGFGRLSTSRSYPDWEDLDLSPLQKHNDYVDVAGSPYILLFRRANGDVHDHTGKLVGREAVKLIASGSQSGYLNERGLYFPITEADVPDELQPMKSLVKYFDRRLVIKQNGDLAGWGGEYSKGTRSVPEAAQKNIKQIASFYSEDMALTEDGRFLRWGKNGPNSVHENLKTGIEKISIFAYTGMALSASNDLYHLNGNKPPFWQKKARNVICRGEFSAILDLENRWHVFAYQKTPRGNELPVLDAVLNRPETIDAEFYLYFSQRNNNNTASYAVWIEENSAARLDINDTAALEKSKAKASGNSGTGFFGVELD